MSSGFSGRYTSGIAKSRIVILFAFSLIFFVVYIRHLFTIQVVKNTEYQNRATAVSRRILPILAQRGEIYDRNGEILVQNIPSFAINIIPAELSGEQFPVVVKNLSEALNMSVEDINKKVPPESYNRYQPIEIKSGVTLEEVARIAEQIEDFPGVTWYNKPIRNYIDVGALSHVIGYVGDITREEFQLLYNKGYDINSVLGKTGIEKQYDQVLRGKDGQSIRTVDVQGRRVDNEDTNIVQPFMGKNIVLTIDKKIQRLAERALGERIGSVVVIKPSTGEILAMVSYPYFDPNKFYTSEASEVFTSLALNPYRPFLNRVIQSAYAPASTFKIIVTAGVANENAFPLDATVYCPGYIRFGNRTFKCWNTAGHGNLNLIEGLANSCNVFFMTMASYHLGIEKLVKYCDDFGLGQPTGIDISGEISGILPSPEWKEQTYNDRWVGGDTVNMAIGQGYLLVTPLQLANYVSMVANDGTRYKPKLIKEIRDPSTGDIIQSFTPEISHESICSPEAIKITQDAMRAVMTIGTARYVISEKVVQIAGKTGTAEVYDKDADSWTSWFVAYGPYDGPVEDRVTVCVNVEAVNDWEWWAPKAANAIFQGIFADQTYEEVVDTLKHGYLRDNL